MKPRKFSQNSNFLDPENPKRFSRKEDYKKIAVVTIFAIAMAFLETVVVVYLRKLYYPGGFDFPLSTSIPSVILNIEWVREFFTIVMLLSIAILAGKRFYGKLAYFLYSFAIWDIFYYIWLKVVLNWPLSFLTWDLLFLIPFPWASPVLAPVICSLTMILIAFCIINLQEKNEKVKMNAKEWALLVIGALVILYTFLYDYGKLIIANGFLPDFFNLATNQKFLSMVSAYVPMNYQWHLFIIGEALILLSLFLFYIRNKK